MDDPRPFISRAAATGVLKAGMRLDSPDRSERALLLRALTRFEDHAPMDSLEGLALACSLELIERLTFSKEQDDRLLGIRLIPWLKDNEIFAHERLLSIIRSRPSREEMVAALGALRLARGVRRIMRVGDVQAVAGLLKADTRDVRIAAAHTLGELGPSEDASVALIAYLEDVGHGDEFRRAVRALGQTGREHAESHEHLFSAASERFGGKLTDSVKSDLVEILRALQALDVVASEPFATKLRAVVKDYHYSDRIRQEALVCLAMIAKPNRSLVSFLTDLLVACPPRMGETVCRAANSFVRRIRAKFEYVRNVLSELPGFVNALVKHYEAHRSGFLEGSENRLRELRGAIEQAENVMYAYSEYAARKTAADQARA